MKTGNFESIFRIVGIIDSPEDFKFVELLFKKNTLEMEGSQKRRSDLERSFLLKMLYVCVQNYLWLLLYCFIENTLSQKISVISNAQVY